VGWGRVAKHLAVGTATLLFATAAVAQIIPPSEQPGRVPQRFNEPLAPRAQPGPGPISLTSTIAPSIDTFYAKIFERRQRVS
jgi:hypothetical protein